MLSQLKMNNEPHEINKEDSRIQLWIKLDKFDIEIHKTQYDCFFKIINHISEYRRFQLNYYETRKFHFFRPHIGGLLESKISHQKENHNARKMWRYGISIAIRKIKYLRGK